MFDFFLCIFLLSVALAGGQPYVQNIIFNFGAFALLCLSLGIKNAERKYTSLSLSLLLIWSMASIFLHVGIDSGNSLINRYVNIYLLSNGFLYLFSGVMLMTLCVRYLKNIRIVLIFVFVSSIPILAEMVTQKRATIVLSALAAMLVYSVIKKKYIFASCVAAVSALSAYIFKGAEFLRIAVVSRIYSYEAMIGEIRNNILGKGFWSSITDDRYVFAAKDKYGWILRHNDYLSLIVFLGLPVLVIMAWYLIETGRKTELNRYIMLGLFLLFVPFLQCFIFFPLKAAVWIVLWSIFLIKSSKDMTKGTL